MQRWAQSKKLDRNAWQLEPESHAKAAIGAPKSDNRPLASYCANPITVDALSEDYGIQGTIAVP